MGENIVIVHFDEHGELDYYAFGESVRLFIVDERAPHDRVYEWLPRADAEEIRKIIPVDAVIGSSADDRHEAIAARIAGKHVRLVDPAAEDAR